MNLYHLCILGSLASSELLKSPHIQNVSSNLLICPHKTDFSQVLLISPQICFLFQIIFCQSQFLFCILFRMFALSIPFLLYFLHYTGYLPNEQCLLVIGTFFI